MINRTFNITFLVSDVLSEKGYFIPTEVVKRYLKTDNHKWRTEKGLILGTVTHRPRREKSEESSVEDKILADKVYTHKFSNLTVKGNKVMADIEFFEGLPEDVQGNVDYVCGLYNNGVEIPISAVVLADWEPRFTEEGEEVYYALEIYDIPGGDTTLTPDFKQY